ncbi:hypothetical protein PVK06_008323 [Gossypium arboreum]|uniref:Uncharacterized protein n=1 Tax=Gossypium arboreum TaxID=29729 RepID=A0ABR0QJZ9_GOSAR|nr:hypothetical protein PVK06_008323 [Gossypium arboreum]
MSRKRTKSLKTTPENPILINEEVKERFDSIFKHQPMIPEKDFNLKSHDLMVVLILIRKKINALKWKRFCDARSLPDDKLVREFYASLTMQDATEVIIRKKKVPLTSKSINDLFNLPDVEEDKYYPMMNNINWHLLQQVLDIVTNPGPEWIIRKFGSHSCQREYLKPVAKVSKKSQLSQIPRSQQNETGTEANSVTITEEESDKELNSPKPIEGFANPESKVEPEEETVKLSVEPKSTTPMLTSASTSKKSELSIMMDMCKFMHNKQQTH